LWGVVDGVTTRQRAKNEGDGEGVEIKGRGEDGGVEASRWGRNGKYGEEG